MQPASRAGARVAGLLLALSRRPRRAWLLLALPTLTTALVSAGVLAAGSTGHSTEILYIWIALYCAFFLTRRELALELAWIATAYAGALAAQGSFADSLLPWLLIVLTAAVSAVVLSLVRETVTEMLRNLADAAHTDPLTGLENRRGLEERIALEVERARRHDRSLTVVIGDLDHFKRVNDIHGHRAGDEALALVGHILSDRKRRVDAVARTGGEEFTLVMPDTDREEAYLVTERLRTEIERRLAGARVPLTLSFGIAAFPEHGRTPELLLEAADQALYSAKALGRNRSVIYNPGIASAFAPVRVGTLQGDLQLATLLSLAEALDMRDTGTTRHSHAVGRYCELIAQQLGLAPERIERVRIAGMLHDIGKVGIPDALLAKRGRLTAVERSEITTHPEIGAQLLSAKGFEDLREWVLAHHERPDGRGYPRGLADEQIPLEAKILAVGDAYEAMTADRPYRSALGLHAARSELLRCAGEQFDSRVVSALLAGLTREADARDVSAA
jgi:diguanylate cyclase (GGDEF)-like protein/putative nucleotidyltransferase with HDIG domain